MLRKASFVFTAFIALIHTPAVADASENQERVAIEAFRGPHAQRLQGAVETGLMGRYYLVPDFSVEEMARKRGVALDDPSGMAEVGRALQVRAFLSAEVQKKRAWQVQVVVRRGDTGQAIGRFVVADRKLASLESKLGARASRRVGALLARASAAEAAGIAGGSPLEPTPVLSEAADDADEAEDAESEPGELVEATLQTRVFNRSFAYNQNLSSLSDYSLEGALAASLSAKVHPLATLSPALAGIGITAGLEYGLGVGSRIAGSEQRISTDVHGYSVGLGYRVRLGSSTVTPTVGYGLSTFNAGQNPAAPNVDYRYIQPGVAGRWAATDRFSVLVEAEYLHVLSAGALTQANRFPRADVRGVEASLGVGFALLKELEIEAGGGIRRFGVATNVVPGDRWIAGGAVDQTTWLGFGVAYRPTYRRAR